MNSISASSDSGTTSRALGSSSTSVGGGSHVILVSRRQNGNKLLGHITNVPWRFEEGITPDFVLGPTTCALFLSLRFHQLHGDYLYSRIEELKREFQLRVILVLVDIQDEVQSLMLIMSLASANGFTVILTWSHAECARYIETYKASQNKTAEIIQKKQESDLKNQQQNSLCAIRSVNRTDALTLINEFGSFKRIAEAEMEELVVCNGIGPAKAQQIYTVFNEPW